VNWQDQKGMVTSVVQETHLVMACLIQSKTVVLKNVSSAYFVNTALSF